MSPTRKYLISTSRYLVAATLGILMGTIAFSAELMSSADVMDEKEWSVTIYGRHAESEPVVRVSNRDAIQFPLSGGGAGTLFATSNTEIQMQQSFNSLVAAVRFRPNHGLTYRMRVGSVENYELAYSSGSHSNRFDGTGRGVLMGFGAEWNMVPGTIVSPAMTLDISATRMIVALDRFRSPGVDVASNNSMEQDDIQAAFNVSKRYGKIEPFGGLKVNRTISRLKDKLSKRQIRGDNDGWSPFVGAQFEFFPGEMIVAEASFVDEVAFSAGLKLKF